MNQPGWVVKLHNLFDLEKHGKQLSDSFLIFPAGEKKLLNFILVKIFSVIL